MVRVTLYVPLENSSETVQHRVIFGLESSIKMLLFLDFVDQKKCPQIIK